MSDLFEDMAWLDDAACFDMSIDDFFPADGIASKKVIATCASCPVRAQCVRWAYKADARASGYFGGLAPSLRRTLTVDEAVDVALSD